jgi:stage IV sporulation protein FB
MRLLRIAGIDFKVNLAFLLLGLIYILLGLGQEVLLISTAVLTHELAHTMVALHLGVRISQVELLPFGGQAVIEDYTGLEPKKEIYSALAGPLLSLFLAAVFYWIIPWQGPLFSLFFYINLFLGCFNLLPALPLDGGRILRAILSGKLGYRKATLTAVFLGKAAAMIIGASGIYWFWHARSGANLIIISILLFWAASREKNMLAYAFMRFLLNKKQQLSQLGFMESQQLAALPNTSVKIILDNSRPSAYLSVLIIGDDESAIGIVTEAELIECLLEKGPDCCLKDC